MVSVVEQEHYRALIGSPSFPGDLTDVSWSRAICSGRG